MPPTVNELPKERVCPGELRVNTLNVCAAEVKAKGLVMLVAVIERVDAVLPVIEPLVDEAGKTAIPLNVNVCPFKEIIPLVCVNVPPTVSLVPSFNV